MSRHSRKIETNTWLTGEVSGGLRTSIRIERADLLFRSQIQDPLHHTNKITLPFPEDDNSRHLVGPNIQEITVIHHVNASPVRMLRLDNEFFIPEEKRLPGQFSPKACLRSSILTGGVPDGDSNHNDFVRVRKKSTVSISTIAFKLMIAMTGDFEDARDRIAELAEEAWERDLERAVKLYDFILANGGRVKENMIPHELKATSAISQEIESKILKSSCLWFGIDPDSPLPKAPRGRPKAKPRPRPFVSDEDLKSAIDEESSEGEIIRITLRGENVRGILLAACNGIPENTDLASLSLMSLVELLGTFKENNLDTDSVLLEAYLDATWPSWRDRVGGASRDTSEDASDPYEILGVSRGATKDEVKRAYHKVMLKVHPDQSGLSSYFSIAVGNAYKKILAEIV
jgi:hypothetical protein